MANSLTMIMIVLNTVKSCKICQKYPYTVTEVKNPQYKNIATKCGISFFFTKETFQLEKNGIRYWRLRVSFCFCNTYYEPKKEFCPLNFFILKFSHIRKLAKGSGFPEKVCPVVYDPDQLETYPKGRQICPSKIR